MSKINPRSYQHTCYATVQQSSSQINHKPRWET